MWVEELSKLNETSSHQNSEGNEMQSCQRLRQALVVTSQPAVAADPGQRPLDNPTLREHDEAVLVAAAHDLERPWARPSQSGFHLAALIPCISDDALDEREGAARLLQEGFCSISILHAC